MQDEVAGEGPLKHFRLHSQWWRLHMEGAIIVSTVTLKHFEPHYQPDSHAARLSHSERAITQPDTQTQLETEWNERAQTVQLLPDTR